MAKVTAGRVVAGMVAVALAMAGLVGCGGGKDDVLSAADVSGANAGGSGDDSGKSQRQRSEAFYACLTDAGLPFRIDEYDDTQSRVQMADTGYRIALIRNPNGDAWPLAAQGVELSDDEWANLFRDPFFNGMFDKAADDALAGPTPTTETASPPAAPDPTTDDPIDPNADWVAAPGLVIDGVDHSEAYAACWRSSGYSEPEYQADPTEELKQKQAQVDANNAWAACARQNGYPNLQDNPAPVADEWSTFPEGIKLPGDITVEALRTLLEVCPNFDQKRATEMYEEYQKPNPDYDKYKFVSDPSISFAFTSGDADNPASESEIARQNALSEALYADLNAFYETLYADQNGGVAPVPDKPVD